MDGFNEKKWFVYLTDHHEGPFSLAELQAKMAERQINTGSFVWCDGMGDWKPMKDVPECESIVNPGASQIPDAPQVPQFSGPDLELAPMPTAQSEPTLGMGLNNDVGLSSQGPELSIGTPVLEEAAPAPAQDPSVPLTGRPYQANEPAELSSPGLMLSGGGTAEPATAAEAPLQAKDEFSMVGALGADAAGGIPAAAPKRGKFLFLALFLVALAGGGYAFTQGYLDPVLQSPALKSGLGSVQDFAYPYLQLAADKVPALGKWISPLPPIADVSPEEYQELKGAAAFSGNPADVSVAMALSTEDPTAPAFYVSSFLPDGAEFEVYVEGIPETLLNHLGFRQRLKVKLGKRFGKSDPVRMGTSPLPRGKYKITVMEAETQAPEVAVLLSNSPGTGVVVPAYLPKGRKLIVTKTYFLGGPEDETYLTRLKEFHDKLRARASNELSEVNQFSATLENQLASTLKRFAEFRKIRKLTPAHRKNWDAFHKSWGDLSAQLAVNFAKWTPESLQKEYFYSPLYKFTKQAGEAVIRVHDLHHQFFTMKVLPKAFDIQIGEAEASAQTAISTLKAKIAQAQSMASETIPRREGL